jgi:peptide/nickel transport system permease protein
MRWPSIRGANPGSRCSGVSLVFFWVMLAVSAPVSAAPRPQQAGRPLHHPFTEKNGVFYWLGTDTRGRDMLSRTIWGCQRVLVWGITATTVAYSSAPPSA